MAPSGMKDLLQFRVISRFEIHKKDGRSDGQQACINNNAPTQLD